MKRTLMAALLAVCTVTAFALPSVDAVRAEVAQGHDAQAEQMIREVLAARPDSARARYVHAEILAHQGRFAQAAEEAAQARRLDPALSFTQPETFKSFEAMLAREQSAAAATRGTVKALHVNGAGASGGIPGWVWGGGLALLAMLFLSRFAFASRPAPMAGPAAMAPVPAAPGMGPAPAPYGMVPAAPAGAAGSGLLGTGLAVAGGVAAGMLAERLIEGHREPVASAFASTSPGFVPLEPFDDLAPEAAAARELEQRPIDMGLGDGWGGADADPGSSDGRGDSDGW